MNIHEGARRIKKVGNISTLIGGSAAALMLVYSLLTRYTDLALKAPHVDFGLFYAFIFLSIYPLVGGFLLLIMGYIVEGFAKPTSTPPSGD